MMNWIKIVVISVEFRLRVGHAHSTKSNSGGLLRFVVSYSLIPQNMETKLGL
jgi:hypothetical protein